jgi:cyclic pyranopterin phosphate synthase
MQQTNETKFLTDSFNRRIDYLRISITDKCNLRCVYCISSKGLKTFNNAEIMTDEEIVRFVRIVHKHGLRKVRITGGEPLMRKNILSLISSVKNIGISDLSLTTNGIMLAELAGALKKAGLDRVNISLDTMNAEKYKEITKGGDINRVLEAIKEAERVGLSPVKINVVPIRGINDNEILSFASLTIKKDCHIRFIEFMPVTSDGMWRREKCVGSDEIIEIISRLGRLESFKFRGEGPSRNYRIKGAVGVIGIISPITDHFCNSCNRLRLTSNGKIRPCLFSKDEVDIRTPMRNGADDDEIERLFLYTVSIKPERHKLDENIAVADHIRNMSRIGG